MSDEPIKMVYLDGDVALGHLAHVKAHSRYHIFRKVARLHRTPVRSTIELIVFKRHDAHRNNVHEGGFPRVLEAN